MLSRARPAPSPARLFVPGSPRVIRIEVRQALISYQDYKMLLNCSRSQAAAA